MPGPAWDDDVASARAAENLTQLALGIPAESIQSCAVPTVTMARDWHRSMLQGVKVPDKAYRGGFRGDAHPALAEYEVTIGGLPTTRAASVGEEVRKLVTELPVLMLPPGPAQRMIASWRALHADSDTIRPKRVAQEDCS